MDHTVSREKFAIWQCNNCSLRFTQDPPTADSIGRYYKSEDYISHTNTSKGLINSIYQAVRKRTLKKKAHVVAKATGLDKGVLLDLGSGVGAFAKEMTDYGWQVTALEPDPDARKVARESFSIELLDMDSLHRLPAGSFDCITLWHVLEHVHELHSYMHTFRKLLKKNGKLIIAVPNYTSLDASVFKENWAAYDVPRHLYHFSPLSMRTLMEKNNFLLNEMQPMWWDSYYISLLSSRYASGSTNWLSALITGYRSNKKARRDPALCSSVTYIASTT
jgi:SAM-dependent methyltransferase